MIPLSGSILYIGENAEKFINDKSHVIFSNLNNFKEFTNSEFFDFIFFEDVLQKLDSVEDIISLSCEALKKNGVLIIKVPDFNLYEKYLWPSIFMLDHKLSFSNEIKRTDQNRDTHYHSEDLEKIALKCGFKAIEATLDDNNYDYERPLLENQTKIGASCHLVFNFYK